MLSGFQGCASVALDIGCEMRNDGETYNGDADVLTNSLTGSTTVIQDACALLRAMQSQMGPKRPNWAGSQDEQTTWDLIEQTVQRLEALRRD